MAASVTHKAKAGALLTGTEYEAADAHNVTIAAADVSAAPDSADYLVGTANAGLSGEIAVGTTPGGELGGTWASPTVDASHSGSTHAATQAAAETTASGALTTHAAAADPHTGYQKESEKDAANGYAGLSASSLVADAQIPLTNGVPTTQALGDAAATGTGTRAARSDHKHGLPALGTTAAAVGTSAGGSATTPSKSDHVHATGAGTPSTQAFGDAAAIGSGPAAAMTDHKHAMPANPATALTSLDYLVGTATGTLSGEIVAGTVPAGELGGTWAAPTVNIVHAGATAWANYTPSLTAVTTNPTLGSSTISGRFKLLDSKTGVFIINLSITIGGAWNAGSGEWKFSLPAGWTVTAFRQHVSAHILDNGTTHFSCTGEIASSGTVVWPVVVGDGAGSKVLANAVPITWATGDQVDIQGVVELA